MGLAVIPGNTSSKQVRRDGAFCYKGNAQIVEAMLSPVSKEALGHPNRVLFQFRQSNKRRYAS